MITKRLNPNKLPFLQVQILQQIYLDIYNQVPTTLANLAELTDYRADSKILQDALAKLVEKGFLTGDLTTGFQIPLDGANLFDNFVKHQDYKHKSQYTTKLVGQASCLSYLDRQDACPTVFVVY